ncbi:hypothetical protein CAL7716_066290 [Calothrix sp. PCC 7716]|nr:hypothetical protein CAL7716_066290 [Calothrix sp. PCC 7716]
MWETADKIIKGENKLDVIPVLVELRAWQTPTTCVSELIQKVFRQNSLRLTKEEIADLLFDGRFLLLLDGLNELPNDESWLIVADFQEEYPQTPMIFTTRDLGIGGDFGVKKQLSMQPLTEEQMRQFVRAYLPKLGHEMLKQLGGRLRELGETPLILKMLCDVFDEVKQIPNSRGGLFRYFDREFDKLKGQVAVTNKLRQWKAELLQNLAFAMMRGEKITDLQLVISRTQAEDILEKLLKDRVNSPGEKAKDWLLDLLKHYLIQTVDGEQIQFHHQLFQEYYAAEYLLIILPKLSDEELKKNYLNLFKWTEPLALMLALVDKESQAVRVVRLALNVDLMLGSRLAGEVQVKFQEKTINLVSELSVDQRLKIELLGMTRSKFAVASVKKALNNESVDIRFTATNALGRIGTDTAILGLLKALDDENVRVYQNAAEWLGYLNCKDARLKLLNKLETWEIFVKRQGCLTDKDISVWSSLVKALGEISKDDAILKVRDKFLKYLDENFIIFSICYAYGGSQLLKLIDNNVLLPEIFKALQDQNSNRRRQNAANILSNVDSQAAIPKLVEALEIETDSYVREAILNALAKLDKNCVVPYLINDLQDVSFSEKAAKVLIELNIQEAIPHLRQLLKNQDEGISWLAAVILGKLGRKEAIDVLIDWLTYSKPHVREIAAQVLGELGCQSAIAPLCQALHDECYYVRRSAAVALGKLGCQEAVPELLKALRHYQTSGTNSSVTLEAHQVTIQGISEEELHKLGDELAIEQWLYEFNNCSVFIKVAEALGKLGEEVAIGGLIQALENSSYAAAIVLGKLGKKEAVPTLIKYFRNTHPNLRNEVASALEKFDNNEVIHELISALDDADFEIRLCAAKTLSKISSSKALPSLWHMQIEGKDVINTIDTIQKNCKFYNHKIFHSLPLSSEKISENTSTYNNSVM